MLIIKYEFFSQSSANTIEIQYGSLLLFGNVFQYLNIITAELWIKPDFNAMIKHLAILT